MIGDGVSSLDYRPEASERVTWQPVGEDFSKACQFDALKIVVGFFAKLTRLRLKYAIFNSIAEYEAAIHRFIEEQNSSEAKPFR